MNRKLLALSTLIALGASTAALAGNPLGAYVGVGVGASNVGNNYNNYNVDDCYGRGSATQPLHTAG